LPAAVEVLTGVVVKLSTGVVVTGEVVTGVVLTGEVVTGVVIKLVSGATSVVPVDPVGL
jgi:hypothetical protein